MDTIANKSTTTTSSIIRNIPAGFVPLKVFAETKEVTVSTVHGWIARGVIQFDDQLKRNSRYYIRETAEIRDLNRVPNGYVRAIDYAAIVDENYATIRSRIARDSLQSVKVGERRLIALNPTTATTTEMRTAI